MTQKPKICNLKQQKIDLKPKTLTKNGNKTNYLTISETLDTKKSLF